jgi:hypothetical protein
MADNSPALECGAADTVPYDSPRGGRLRFPLKKGFVVSRPLHGLERSTAKIPALKCWATIRRPLRGLASCETLPKKQEVVNLLLRLRRSKTCSKLALKEESAFQTYRHILPHARMF